MGKGATQMQHNVKVIDPMVVCQHQLACNLCRNISGTERQRETTPESRLAICPCRPFALPVEPAPDRGPTAPAFAARRMTITPLQPGQAKARGASVGAAEGASETGQIRLGGRPSALSGCPCSTQRPRTQDIPGHRHPAACRANGPPCRPLADSPQNCDPVSCRPDPSGRS